MATVDVAKIKIRRGTNVDRQKIVLDSGELGFTTDTQRVFVGDGSTAGGVVVGNKNFNVGSRTTNPIAGKSNLGDLVFGTDNKLYSLSGSNPYSTSSWLMLSPRVDQTTINYNADGKLYVAATYVDTAGDGLSLVGSTMSIDVKAGASANLFTFDGGQLAAGVINDDIHGNLGFQANATSQHHTDASTTQPGFMSTSNFDKLDAAPDYDTLDDTNSTLVVNMINAGSSTKIDTDRVDFGGSISGQSNSSQSLVRVTGSTISKKISAAAATTPYSFLNREDFPGQVQYTSIPTNRISDIGQFQNYVFQINGVASANWVNKAFRIMAGDGTVYTYFVDNGTGAVTTYEGLAPNETVREISWNVDPVTLYQNIVNSINNTTNTLNEKIFDCWTDGNTSPNAIYIQGLIKSQVISSAAFHFPNVGGTDYTPAGVGNFETADHYPSSEITVTSPVGRNTGNASKGSLGLEMFGWVALSSTTDPAVGYEPAGIKEVHTIANFPTGDNLNVNTMAANSAEYFLLYDCYFNRYCVYYYEASSSSSLVIPDISDNLDHIGYTTYFIPVAFAAGDTTDTVGDNTADAINNFYYNDPNDANSTLVKPYNAEYTSPTLTLTSNLPGKTGGLTPRLFKYPGYKANAAASGTVTTTYTSNVTEGQPDVGALKSAFYDAYTTSYSGQPGFGESGDLIVLPRYSGAPTALYAGTNGNVTEGAQTNGAVLIKFR